MSVVKIEEGVVIQKWGTKTLEDVKSKYTGDIRELEAVCGQLVDENNVVTNPPPTPMDPAEATKRAQLRALWGTVQDPAAKKILKILIKDMIDD